MLRNHQPQNALEAKFSLEFAVAAAVIARQVGLEQLRDEFVQRADIQALMPQVRIRIVDTVNPSEPSLALFDEIDIHLQDGQVLHSGPIYSARGTPQQPLQDGELETKFRDCTRELPAAQRDGLWQQLSSLETLKDVRELFVA